MSTTEDGMSTDGLVSAEEMTREELEVEVEELRAKVDDLTNTMEFCLSRIDDFEKILFGEEYDMIGAEIATEKEGAILPRVEKFEDRGANKHNKDVIDRSKLYPAHKMWLDIEAEDGHTLSDNQRRAAHLFGQFLQRAKGESTAVDASGQTYTLSSTDARAYLRDVGELNGVKKSSEPVIVGRVMRETQSLMKFDKCDCEEIEECDHGLITFSNAGTNVLHVPKKRFNAAMEFALETIQSNTGDNTDVRTSSTSTGASEDPDNDERDELLREAETIFTDLDSAN